MDSLVVKSWRRYIRCQSAWYTPSMQHLLDNIEHYLASPYKVLKQDTTSKVVVVKINDALLVIKRANTKSKGHAIRRLFATSRARKSWNNANLLLHKGILTFTPIALMEMRYGPLLGHSYFICSYISGKEAFHFFKEKRSSAVYHQVAKSIVCVLQHLTEHKLSHRDLNLYNIIVKDKTPWLVDLEPLRHHWSRWGARRYAQHEYKRFLKNCRETKDFPVTMVKLLTTLVFKRLK